MVLDLLLPPRCPGCRQPGGGLLCATCLAAIQPLPARRCRLCGDPSVRAPGRCGACLAARPAFRRAFAPGRYAAPLSVAVQALKYHRRRSAAPALGTVMAACVPESVARRVDVVVPVPCHLGRVRRRGIDHAALLAQAVAAALGRPWHRALERTQPTTPQVGLSAGERRANVAGAFRSRASVAGSCVLLVDDVMTTGATSGACAVVLCQAGARAVWVVTAARAATPSPAMRPAVAARPAPRYNAPPAP